jgi:hypothetical protein
LVTLEVLKGRKEEVATFILNPGAPWKELAGITGVKNYEAERTLDKKLFELNERGYPNGHTPFSSVLAFLSVLLAVIHDFSCVAISQERSSNEGNAVYRGKTVNHQYSKSFLFENRFREYQKRYLARKVNFFSFVRPLYDVQIARIFSGYPKYFGKFLSCNEAYKIASRQRGLNGWCNYCPKCLSTFVALYPFVEESTLIKIFGKNLFDEKGLAFLLDKLMGEGPDAVKPFECVGTFKETLAATYLGMLKAGGKKLPFLLDRFRRQILPKYPDIAASAKKIMSSFDKRNNLPRLLARDLKSKLLDWPEEKG